MNLPKKVDIVEVGPRDGLQNEAQFIPTHEKVELIHGLIKANVQRMEVSSFVHPVHVPQMKDASDVFKLIKRKENVQYLALIPNAKGYERAILSGVDALTLVVGVSDTFNHKNVRMSRAQSMEGFIPIIRQAQDENVFIRFALATSFWCPFEGKIKMNHVLEIVDDLQHAQVDEIVLCDTIGRATPDHVYDLFSQVLDRYPTARVAAHFHDTYGFAQANVLAAIQAGITTFDSSVGGLGGCPFAPGAAGNGATEDLVFMLHEMGIETGIDLEQMLNCVALVKRMIERPLTGHLQRVKQM